MRDLNLLYVLNKERNFMFLNSFTFISLLSHLQIPSHAFHLKRKLLSMLQNIVQQDFSKEDNKI